MAPEIRRVAVPLNFTIETLRSGGQRQPPAVPIDGRLLAAIDHGLPDCAGVALGVDRLIMLASGTRNIADVLAFPTDKA